MRLPIALSLAVLVASQPLAAAAQSEHAAHHSGSAVGSKQLAMTNGVVKRVDNAKGSVTIAHEPLVNLGMPAMTMTFLVKDRAWLGGMKEGGKIRFVAEEVNGELTVVAVEQVK